MFRKAHIKLTLIYSLLFLFSFWVFSVGLYFWMDNSFGESYIKQVHDSLAGGQLDQDSTHIVAIAGDVALVAELLDEMLRYFLIDWIIFGNENPERSSVRASIERIALKALRGLGPRITKQIGKRRLEILRFRGLHQVASHGGQFRAIAPAPRLSGRQ